MKTSKASVVFGLASFLAMIGSIVMALSARTVIHEMGAMVLGLTSAVFGVGSVVVYHLSDLPWRIADATPSTRGRKTCPFCVELVREAAVVCRYCGRDLPTPAAEPISDDEPRATREGSLILKIAIILLVLFLGVVAYTTCNQKTVSIDGASDAMKGATV